MKYFLQKIFIIFVIIILIIVISTLLGILPWRTAKKSYFLREKLRPYECGFNPQIKSRNSFSLRFFIITILFLIFDVEIVLLFPLVSSSLTNKTLSIIILIYFLIILIIGVIHEWNKDIFSWTK